MSGVTTMIGGGTGPATGTNATTCTPGPWHIAAHAAGGRGVPDEPRLPRQGQRQPARAAARADRGRRHGAQAARGLGHHAGGDRQLPRGGRRDATCRWRSTPTRSTSRASSRTRSPRSRAAPSTPTTPRARAAATRRTSSSVCGAAQRAALLHQSDAALHGQHHRRAPRHADGLPSPGPRASPRTWPSPNRASAARPSPPRTSCTTSARSRMMSSDSQAMGRVGEVIIRTWQTAHKMKVQRGALPEDTARATTTSASSATSPSTPSTRRSPTASRTRSARSRSGKLADLVLWKPAFFGVKPALILKGGMIAAAADGRSECLDPDAAAGALPADVRRLRRRARAPRSPSSRRRRCRTPTIAGAGAAKAAGRRCATRATSASATWSTTTTCRRSRSIRETYEVRADGELLDLRAGRGAAAGAALLPVLRTKSRMLTLIARCEPVDRPYGELVLPFDLRIRSRLRTRLVSGEEAVLKTERGAVLRGGDCLQSEDGRVVRGRRRAGESDARHLRRPVRAHARRLPPGQPPRAGRDRRRLPAHRRRPRARRLNAG